MRTPRIYQNTSLAAGASITLDKTATHHLTRVLRMQTDQEIILFNGAGGEYLATLSLHGKDASANITHFVERTTESHLNITLMQGISKGDRMDICIQKAVELGVKKIIPVICQRTVVNIKGERSDKKQQHWQGIIVNACEQSGRTEIPLLAHAIKLKDLLAVATLGLKLTLNPDAAAALPNISRTETQISLLIGPEGGLDAHEVALAMQYGFQAVRMGPRILRTETAAIAAIAALQTICGDMI